MSEIIYDALKSASYANYDLIQLVDELKDALLRQSNIAEEFRKTKHRQIEEIQQLKDQLAEKEKIVSDDTERIRKAINKLDQESGRNIGLENVIKGLGKRADHFESKASDRNAEKNMLLGIIQDMRKLAYPVANRIFERYQAGLRQRRNNKKKGGK